MIVKAWRSILLNIFVYCSSSFRQQGVITVFQITLLPLNFNTGLGLSSHRSYEGHMCKMSRQQKFHFMVNVILLSHVLWSGPCIPLHQEMMVWCFVFFSVCLFIWCFMHCMLYSERHVMICQRSHTKYFFPRFSDNVFVMTLTNVRNRQNFGRINWYALKFECSNTFLIF